MMKDNRAAVDGTVAAAADAVAVDADARSHRISQRRCSYIVNLRESAYSRHITRVSI